MDKGGAVSITVDLFKVYDQLGRIVLRICEDFRAKEGDDMIRNDLDRFVTKVCVIDTEVGIKPLHFVRDEFPRDEPLRYNREKKEWKIIIIEVPRLMP
jgi:hypothetical protein